MPGYEPDKKNDGIMGIKKHIALQLKNQNLSTPFIGRILSYVDNVERVAVEIGRDIQRDASYEQYKETAQELKRVRSDNEKLRRERNRLKRALRDA